MYKKTSLIIILILLFISTSFGNPNPKTIIDLNYKEVAIETCYYTTFNVTAYGSFETGGSITASGKRVNTSYIACPKQFKFGTSFEFLGKKYWCYDRGSAINMKTRRLDVLLTSRSGVYKWGLKKNVKVKICTKK